MEGAQAVFPFPLPSCRRTKLFLSSCPAILSSTSQWASFPDTRPKLHVLVFPNTRAPSNQCIPTSHDLPPQTQDGWGGGEEWTVPKGVQTPAVRARAGLAQCIPKGPALCPGPGRGRTDTSPRRPPQLTVRPVPSTITSYSSFMAGEGAHAGALGHRRERNEKSGRSGPRGKGKTRGEEKRS